MIISLLLPRENAMKDFYSLSSRGRALRLRHLARRALQHYGLDVKDIRLITNHYNGVFRVDTSDGKKYALRVCLAYPSIVTQLTAELAWLRVIAHGSDLRVPESILTRDDELMVEDGSTAAAWRLPNTYFVNNGAIQQHAHTGKATHIRQAVRAEISLAEQRGSIGDAALPRSGKRYFTDSEAYKVDAFTACDNYLRKLSRKGGDVFERRFSMLVHGMVFASTNRTISRPMLKKPTSISA